MKLAGRHICDICKKEAIKEDMCVELNWPRHPYLGYEGEIPEFMMKLNKTPVLKIKSKGFFNFILRAMTNRKIKDEFKWFTKELCIKCYLKIFEAVRKAEKEIIKSIND